jgi:hypothetical protein
VDFFDEPVVVVKDNADRMALSVRFTVEGGTIKP